MAPPEATFGRLPPGGAASGPAEPDPRRPLGGWRVLLVALLAVVVLMAAVAGSIAALVSTEAGLRDVLSGHICRCTGYAGIMAALCEAAGVAPTDLNRREP